MKPGGGSFFKEHAIKTKYGFDRVVEDLIQEAMSKGQFTNLEGAGKPLTHAQSQNPYVDFTQHKINKILLDNGFTPEWITLKKEIRTEIDDLVENLTEKRSYYGELPLNESERNDWMNIVEQYERRADDINKKIDKYNLIVPILDQQMCQIQFDKIAEKILNSKPKNKNSVKINTKHNSETVDDKNPTLLMSLISWIEKNN